MQALGFAGEIGKPCVLQANAVTDPDTRRNKTQSVCVCVYLQSVVYPGVEVLELVLWDGGVVGAEELLDLQAGQAAVSAPLPQPAGGLEEVKQTPSKSAVT